MSAITLLITGGTLDKVYDETLGKLTFKESNLTKILQQTRSTLDIDLQQLMLVDSLEMTSEQRTEIVRQCKNTLNSRIIITHGTDTMVETAEKIAKENLQKTIVITGAMIPYNVNNSDSLFNLGSALAFVQTLTTGVYIAMNGHYFSWNEVQKNKSLGLFENL